jgi:MFS-type transporter involved in bile tolerance (Atg22 family)
MEKDGKSRSSDEEVYGRFDRDRFLPVASWTMYDFANTIYSAIVVTFFLSLYVTKELGGTNLVLGFTTFASMLFSALISPFLGALPDRTGKTKLYLGVFTVACCVMTFAISLPRSVWMVMAFFFVANVCYQISMVFYNSLLPVVASPRRQGMVSGMGVALGYIGVIVGLLVASLFIGVAEEGDTHDQLAGWKLEGVGDANSDGGVVLIELKQEQGEVLLRTYRHDKEGNIVFTARAQVDAKELPARVEFEAVDGSGVGGEVTIRSAEHPIRDVAVQVSYRFTFLTAGILFFLFALPLFFWVPERAVRNPAPGGITLFIPATRDVLATIADLFRKAWLATFRRTEEFRRGEAWRKRNVFMFLLGNFLCVDVLNTAIQWFSKYMDKVFSFSRDEVILFGLGMSSAAFLGGVAMGKLTDVLGARRAVILAALLLLGTLLVTGLAGSAVVVVVFIMAGGAMGLAGLWVAGRKLLIELAPPEKIGEYFGLYGITIKISVLGTLVFSFLTDWGESVGSLFYKVAVSLPGGADMHWNYRLAILSQIIMLVPGILLLVAVRPEIKPDDAQPALQGEP